MKIEIILLISIFSEINFVFGDWQNQLSDYDILPNLNIRVSRSTFDNKQIHFSTKFRKFKLILKPSVDLFTKDFKSVNIDRFGRETPVPIDDSQFYQGFVSGAEKSSVSAFLGNDKMLSINIILDDDIFQVEPLSRYVQNNSSFLVYRYSDLKGNFTRGPKCFAKNISSFEANSANPRPKRNAYPIINPPNYINKDNAKKLCTIKLIADYRFHHEHGRGEMGRTQHYLIELIDKINILFKSTDFIDLKDNNHSGYGFIINQILVHVEPTIGTSGHYNQETSKQSDAWTVEGLLDSFGDIDHNDSCLAHLFTFQSFSEGTLGLAYMASSKTLNFGGICSKRDFRHQRSKFVSVNTAWSTYRDAVGKRVISMSAYLVTAHELGHNWGADHDPDTIDCAPNAARGGKYVMYTYSVVGYEPNNRLFSPCSRRNIGATIATRGEHCLLSPINAFCGNSRVDEDEECDVGKNNSADACCTSNCHFKPGAVCSPYNHECCTNDCQFKPYGFVCAAKDPMNPCVSHSICTGKEKECLGPLPIDGPNCTEHGRCNGGKCRPYCEQFNMEACICDKTEESCLICCRDPPSKSNSNTIQECRPAQNGIQSRLTLNQGRPCALGVCEEGVCKRRVNKLIERIWKIIDEFNTNLFAAFLLENLVGTVIILTLLLWIPAAIMVSCNDAKHRRRFLQERKSRRPEMFENLS